MSDDSAERRRSELLELQDLFRGLEDHQRAAALSAIRNLNSLGKNACNVLTAIGERLAMGAKQYKEDFTTERDWFAESAAEAFDGAVYLALALTKLTSR